MSRLAPFLTFCGAVLAGQAQAEVCMSQNARTQFGFGGNFRECQVLDVLRQGLFTHPYPQMGAIQEFGGDENGPWVRYWILIGPVDYPSDKFEESAVSEVEGGIRGTVCSSDDLSPFVSFGGRVGFDIQVLTSLKYPQVNADHTTLATFWVDTCEAP